MLLTYSRRTGVNWNARTVLGKNPFLATDTDIVRVRFPDWSLWNLPLMAHEFGHLAAPATAAFMAYQKQESEQAIEGHPDPVAAEACSYADARRHQLDEFFADVFATYTAGPAFACDVIALQLDPAEAYLWRGGHPTHDERVQVVLQTLGEMNKQTQKRIGDPGLYGVMLNQLGQGWKDAVERCGGMVTNEGVYRFQLKQALRWGRKIYCHLDMFYRLGAGYTSERWQYAMKLAKRLLLAPVPEIGQIQEMAEEYRMEEVTFDDILNALWWARLGLAKDQRTTADLTSAANLIGERFLGT
jgi:hypothetical protein